MPNDLHNVLMRLGLSNSAAGTVELLIRPGEILLTVALAAVAGRMAARATRRFVFSLVSRTQAQARSDRAPNRATALASSAAGLARVGVWIVAASAILGELHANLGPFIAGATVIGAALGFGAQTVVKDLLAGIMILGEDQFGVGDTISLDSTSGAVEDVNLLRTRIRADDGKVWFISNGEIRKVANGSLGWVRATADLVLPYETDLDAAVEAATEEAGVLAREPEWAEAILAPPEAHGEAVRPDGITIRVTAKTRPAQSTGVARALLQRVNRRLRRGGTTVAPAAPPTGP